MEATLKRLYVGGISPLVTKAELADRFGKFGKIDDVEIVYRKDDQGNAIKTFAYLNVNISDVDLKKCMSVLNKTKWKGGTLQIEIAKESFLHRLSEERQKAKEKEKANAQRSSKNDLVLSLEKAGVTDFQMKTAVPGTEVPNHKNWVVSKFGRVLPVLYLNEKKQSKIKKYDPSKYCHNIKKVDNTFELVPVSQLTWQLEGGDDEISRKRRGEFPKLTPPPKKKLKNVPINAANDTQTDQRVRLASIQTDGRQSDTKTCLYSKKPLHLQNRSTSSMTEEYDSEDELQSVLERERAARTSVNYVEDSTIEVVADSFELNNTTHKAKRKAAAKMNSTSDTLDDSEYDSADTDEIITSAKKVQKSCDNFKTTKDETISEKFNPLKIQEGTTHGTRGKCKSKDGKMSKPDSDSDTGASEDDSSSCYSDEEYKAMMQNCFKLNLTMGDLETLAKEANEFENDDANDTVENDGEYDDTDDDINAKQGYDDAENPPALGCEKLPAPEKKQKTSTGVKKKMKTESLQRVLESDSSNSDFDEHYESLNKNCSRENVKIEPKSPRASQSLVNNHELEKGAKGLKGEANKSKEDPRSEHVKKNKKSGIEPEDIVASILEEDSSSSRQSNQKKNDAHVKLPEFKGLSSVLASAATINSQAQTATVPKISSDLNVSSYASKQTKKADTQEPSGDLKQIILKEKSKNRCDHSEECKSDLNATSSSAPKPGISQIGKKMEQPPTNVKQQQDNEKRLVAMMERRKERELQKQIIQGALLQLDSRSSKKHIVFESESESEKEEKASTSEIKSMHADYKEKQDTSKLFSSSEEDSDNEDKEDTRFEIKAQYEGRSGMKLMQLQSRFGTDERFKMDTRFLESSSEDEESLEANQSKVDEEHDLSAEKKKNLGILQSIMNIDVEPESASKKAAKGKKFKDLNALHYDPAKEDHATFETKAEDKKERKSERKKRLEAEKLPDVSKETFHEVIMDFREVFGASKTQDTKEPKMTWDQEVELEKKETVLSMSNELFPSQSKNTEEPVEFTFSFFGTTSEGSTPNNEPYKTETIKPAKVAWQEDPRFQDSSSEEEDDEDATVATENTTSLVTRPDVSTVRFFFFVKDDQRLKIGPTMFLRSSNTEQEEEAWEQRKDVLLEDCRKRHKDAKRKMKAKN
ncbi:PREDICTED: nucleolar protein 8 [Nanorana parkeri]|uniref:nucleolar protein 8 n=1 Tax=Nanorana parkeri TaxID=125878 RepID=UPI0008547D99|nr:PREDICTED: nucleolar protein 8 [Nanorana parkeri]